MLREIGTYGAYVSGLIIWGAGCSAVLGIEDLGSAPRLGADSGNGGDGNGGSSGDASVGGASSGGRNNGTGNVSGGGGTATGGRNNGGAGGSLPDGSAGSLGAGGLGGAGGIGAGGAGGIGNGGAGGGGQGGSGGATGSTVNGKVIDFWGHAVPNVIVEIGTSQANTGPSGAFTIAGVGGTYDVALVPNLTLSTRGWIFQGLTRRDPTLQIDEGFDWKRADTYTTTAGVTLPIAGQTIGYAFGSPDGTFRDVIDESPENLYWVYYYGPATSPGGAHALRWTLDPTTKFPDLYKAYDTVPITLVEEPTMINFNLALGDDATGTGTISGKVTTGAGSRENHVYVRFKDGAAIEVVNDGAPTGANGNYSYKVPTSIPDTPGITVAAVAGYFGGTPIAVIHKDDAAAGDIVDLTIPSPQALLAPVDAATATANTSFTWTGAAGVSVFSISIDPFNTNVPTTMHIVTAAKTVKLPSFATAASYTIPPGKECFWWVETHGSGTTVDAAAGPTGFLAAFMHHTLEGSRRGGGSYTESGHRSFTSPP